MFRIRPDVTQSISDLDGVTTNYSEREAVLASRVREKTSEARRLGLSARMAVGAERDVLRRQAVLCLKSRAQLEDQLNKTVARHLAVEGQRLALEDASLTADALEALRGSSRVLEAHGRILDMQKVTHLLDKLENQMESAAEIGDAFAEHPSSIPGSASAAEDPGIEEQLDALLEEDTVSLPIPAGGGGSTASMNVAPVAPVVRNDMVMIGGDEEPDSAARPLLADTRQPDLSTRLHMSMA